MGVIRDVKKTIQAVSSAAGAAWQHRNEIAHFIGKMQDTSVPSFSLFVREDIGIQDQIDAELKKEDRYMGQVTGIYVPSSIKSLDKVNVILYFHGDKVRIWDQTGTIRDYLNLPQLPLRQGLNASGKAFILVAPTLGMRAAAEAGNVGANVDSYLDDVMEKLGVLAPQMAPAKTPAIGDLIIAGHSGGYGPITSALSSIKKYRGNIKEVWGFDIMYGSTADSMQTANATVYAYFNDTESHSRSLARKKNPRIFVMDPQETFTEKGKVKTRRVSHDLLMMKFWADRCQRIGTNGTNAEDQKLMI